MKEWKQKITELAIVAGVFTGSIPMMANSQIAPAPKGLWQAFSKVRHKIEPVKNAQRAGYAYKAYNLKMHYGIHFGAKGIVLRTKAGDMTMGLVAYGEEKQLKHVSISVSKSKGNKVIFQYARLSEWYINDPKKGLEQGFTLQKPENYHHAKPVAIALKIEGKLQPKQQSDTAVAFYSSRHKKVFDYKGLKAFDAKGRSLPAHLALQGDMLHIIVETAEAQWPVSVDPVFVSEQEVVASDALENDQFGSAVALDGDTALIGATLGDDDNNGEDTGAVYVFTRAGTIWSEQAKLTASNGSRADYFGSAVALDGDTALVGAYGHYQGSGAVYVFTRSGTDWSQQQMLYASDLGSDDHFGRAVSLNGNTAFIGSPDDDDNGSSSGSVYVFTYSPSNQSWSQQQKLTASDADRGDYFGSALSLDGDTVLIGSPHNNDSGSASGSAYIFTRLGTFWREQQKLVASDAAESDFFGRSVALDNGTALISATGDDNGSVYVFSHSGTMWHEQTKLTASDAVAGDGFGQSISLSGNTALISAPYYHYNTGAVYIFTRLGTTWNERQKMIASDAQNYDFFGKSVLLDANTALIGAPNNTENDVKSGTAYFITLPKENQNITPVIMYLLD